METYYIYIIRNKITNAIYVGQTNNPKRRWAEHRSLSNKHNNHSKLYKDMNKHGFKNFEMEILEEVPYELKDMKEEYYIKKLDALSENNYNEIQGTNLLKNINHNLIVKDYLDGMSASKIASKYNVKHPQIITLLKNELGEEQYSKLSEKHKIPKKNIPIETIVDLIENKGYSKKQTADLLNVCDSTIVRRYNKWKKSQDENYIVNPKGRGAKEIDVNLIIETYLKLNSTRLTAKVTGYGRQTVRKYLKKAKYL